MTGNLMHNGRELTKKLEMNCFAARPIVYEDVVKQLRQQVLGME